MTSSAVNKAAAAVLKPALDRLKERLDPDTYGGAPLLGVDGVCIIGHGSSKAKAVCNGIRVAAQAGRGGLTAADRREHLAPARLLIAAAPVRTCRIRRRRTHRETGTSTHRMTRYAEIIGIGSYLPERDADERRPRARWSTRPTSGSSARTGIRERRIVAEGETTSDLAARAARIAHGPTPGVAARRDRPAHRRHDEPRLHHSRPPRASTQAKLGLTCPAFDVMAACTSFIYALAGGRGRDRGRPRRDGARHRRRGAHAARRLHRPRRRACCSATAPARSCCSASRRARASRRSSSAPTAPARTCSRSRPAARRSPSTHERDRRARAVREDDRQRGLQVRRARHPAGDAGGARRSPGTRVDDLRWLVPHQANQRIIDTIEERLGIADERVYCNLAQTGNTSAASIPLALDDLYTSGRLAPGDLLALVGFGAGLTWGAAVVRWTMTAPDRGGLEAPWRCAPDSPSCSASSTPSSRAAWPGPRPPSSPAAVSNAGGLGIIGAGHMPTDLLREQIRNAKAAHRQAVRREPHAADAAHRRARAARARRARPGRHHRRGQPRQVHGRAQGAGHQGAADRAVRRARQAPGVHRRRRHHRRGHGGRRPHRRAHDDGAHARSSSTRSTIPVVAAGGIADGRGMAAAFALGAEGVQVGTRFMCAEECTIHPAVKAAGPQGEGPRHRRDRPLDRPSRCASSRTSSRGRSRSSTARTSPRRSRSSAPASSRWPCARATSRWARSWPGRPPRWSARSSPPPRSSPR